jgi:hypothetical protein
MPSAKAVLDTKKIAQQQCRAWEFSSCIVAYTYRNGSFHGVCKPADSGNTVPSPTGRDGEPVLAVETMASRLAAQKTRGKSVCPAEPMQTQAQTHSNPQVGKIPTTPAVPPLVVVLFWDGMQLCKPSAPDIRDSGSALLFPCSTSCSKLSFCTHSEQVRSRLNVPSACACATCLV